MCGVNELGVGGVGCSNCEIKNAQLVNRKIIYGRKLVHFINLV